MTTYTPVPNIAAYLREKFVAQEMARRERQRKQFEVHELLSYAHTGRRMWVEIAVITIPAAEFLRGAHVQGVLALEPESLVAVEKVLSTKAVADHRVLELTVGKKWDSNRFLRNLQPLFENVELEDFDG